MSKIKLSTNDEVAIAEFIADIGGLKSPTDDELWEIVEALNLDDVKDLVFLENS